MLHAAHARWLREQLPALVERRVLDPEAAARLGAYYEEPSGARSANLVMVLLGALGAVLVGGGVILLIAHNWDELTRLHRTGLSFAPLAVAVGMAAWVVATRRSEAWREAAGSLWVLSIAATLSLVSQTYHLPGDGESFLRACLLLAFPVAYLLDAVTAGVLYLLALLAWVLASGARDTPLYFWPLLVLVIPFAAWRLRRFPESPGSELLGWAGALTLGLGAFSSLPQLNEALWGPLGLAVGLGIWAGGLLGEDARWARPLRVVGAVEAFAVALALTSAASWHRQASHPFHPGLSTSLEATVVAAVTVSALLLLALAARQGSLDLVLPVGAALPWGWGAWTLSRIADEKTPALVMNGFLVVLGVALLAQGMRADRLRRANIGTAIVGLIILLRFFDTDWGFLWRGVVFIATGVGFLLVNWVLLRRRRAAP